MKRGPRELVLGQLADGTVVFDRVDSHLDGHPEARPLLPEVFARLTVDDFRDGWWVGVVDLGRVLGLSTCVRVRPGQPVCYARRLGRAGWTRFVSDRAGEPCSTLKVVLRREVGGRVELRTAFVGGDAPPEPWSPSAALSAEAHARSVAFWRRHALIWDGSGLDPEARVYRRAPRGYWATPSR